jgi:hypothetical protein
LHHKADLIEGTFMANVLQMMTNAVTGGDDIGDIVGQLDAAKAKGAAAYQEIERLEVQRSPHRGL